MRARVPADVDMPDRIFAGLTLRQLTILSVDVLILWVLYFFFGRRASPILFGVFALPVAAAGLAVATARPQGVSVDRLLLAAGRYLRSSRRRIHAPDEVPGPISWAPKGKSLAPIGLPVRSIQEGPIDLGSEGSALICRATGLNLGLRAESEQEALVEGFGRLLNSFDSPVQFLMRSTRMDLAEAVGEIEERAAGLPHPSLREAAREHAFFLLSLGKREDVLTHKAFVCLRDRARAPEQAAVRLRHYFDETSSILQAIGIRLQMLTTAEAFSVLREASDPEGQPSPPDVALPADVIVGAPR